MSETPEVDPVVAMDLIRAFCKAVLDSPHMPSAMRLMTPEARREWADDWVVGVLEDGRDLFDGSEREQIADSLASVDTDHRVWEEFADDTLASWREHWAVALRHALEGSDPTALILRQHRTIEELHALGGEWSAVVGRDPNRKRSPQVYVDFSEVDGILRIADIMVDD